MAKTKSIPDDISQVLLFGALESLRALKRRSLRGVSLADIVSMCWNHLGNDFRQEVVIRLGSWGADVEGRNDHGMRAVDLAIMEDDASLLRTLVEQLGADVDKSTSTCAAESEAFQKRSTFEWQLDLLPDVSDAFKSAVLGRRRRCVAYLIAIRPHFGNIADAWGNYLHKLLDDPEAISLLSPLRTGIDLKRGERYLPAADAIRMCKPRGSVKALLKVSIEAGLHLTEDSGLLFAAAEVDDVEVAAHLMGAGANPFAGYAEENIGIATPRFHKEMTPFLVACLSGSVRVVQLMLDHGVGPHYDKDGTGAVGWAAQHGHVQTLKLLLEHGYDPDDRCGVETPTPLEFATNSYGDATYSLQMNGRDPNTTVDETTLLFQSLSSR